MAEPALQVDRLEVDFPTKDGVVHAVRGVDFTLDPARCSASSESRGPESR